MFHKFISGLTCISATTRNGASFFLKGNNRKYIILSWRTRRYRYASICIVHYAVFAGFCVSQHMTDTQNERKKISYASMDSEVVSEHKRRMSSFIEHNTDLGDHERYQRKLRIKSMKRPHLSKETLNQMYGIHRYKTPTTTDDTPSEFDTPTTGRRYLGPITGFGDGNGSFWDRWLVKEPPPKSSFANGNAYPLRGYKRLHPSRYQVYEQPPSDPNGQVSN